MESTSENAAWNALQTRLAKDYYPCAVWKHDPDVLKWISDILT